MEIRSVNAVTVTQQKTGGLIEGKRLDDLLGGPLGRGMFGGVEVDHHTWLMTQDHEAVEDAKGERRDDEEVNRHDVPETIIQKGWRQGFSSKTHGCIVPECGRTLPLLSGDGHDSRTIHTPHMPPTAWAEGC